MLTKSEILLGSGPPGREQEDKGTQEDCSAAWLSALGFYSDGISFPVVFGQSF